MEVGCIQEVVIQVVVEFILGVGYIQVEVLAYILAVVGIVSRVKYKKPLCGVFLWSLRKIIWLNFPVLPNVPVFPAIAHQFQSNDSTTSSPCLHLK
jgi:hypothetical protein